MMFPAGDVGLDIDGYLLYKFFIEAPVSYECFFWMKIFVESLSNNRVCIDTDTHLL